MKLLVAYSARTTFVGTTWEYLDAFRRHRDTEVQYVHVTHDSIPKVEWGSYDAVIVSYCARLSMPGYVSRRFLDDLSRFRGVRALVLQDEYENTNELLRQAERIDPDLIFSCILSPQRERVYPPERFARAELHTVHTGFVPDDHKGIETRVDPRKVAERPVGIGYRGRRLSPAYGRLGRLKAEVGEVMRSEARRRHVSHDISIEESDRIYGDAWIRFIASCRCMLGSESGSNVFDWDGAIQRRCLTETDPESLRRIAAEIEREENDLGMGQISPRIFECAMMRTPMALVEGGYSGILEAGTHYISIAEDFTNLDEVFEALVDLPAMQAMADRTHADLVESGVHSSFAHIGSILRTIRATIERAASIRTEPETPPIPRLPHPALRFALTERATSEPRKRVRSLIRRYIVAILKRLSRITGGGI